MLRPLCVRWAYASGTDEQAEHTRKELVRMLSIRVRNWCVCSAYASVFLFFKRPFFIPSVKITNLKEVPSNHAEHARKELMSMLSDRISHAWAPLNNMEGALRTGTSYLQCVFPVVHRCCQNEKKIRENWNVQSFTHRIWSAPHGLMTQGLSFRQYLVVDWSVRSCFSNSFGFPVVLAFWSCQLSDRSMSCLVILAIFRAFRSLKTKKN